MKKTNHKVIQGKFRTAEDRISQCAASIQRALDEHGCMMFTALKVGNAETPLAEIGGLPIVVKVATNDSQT